MCKKYFNIYLFLIINIFLSGILLSQNGGTITGRVLDSESGDPLRSATILLVETKKGAYSDVKGTYKLKNIPAGSYTLKISYIGYISKELKNLEITNDTTLRVDVVLLPESRLTEEVVVEARRTNDNEAAILSVRKNAAQVSDGISSEEIKKSSDGDAGQSLRRVSGITLVNDKFVYVRGISERYSNTTLNGSALASTEPDKKAFSFDMFPSEFLQNASISKSFTPDLPGNFAGGLVQLNTVDFPAGFSFKIKVGTAANDNITLHNNTFQRYTGGSGDWLGFDNTRAMPSTIPSSPSEMKALLGSLKNIENEEQWKKSSNQWQSINQGFNNDLWKRDTLTAPLNQNYAISYTDLINVGGNDLGVLASLIYNNNYNMNIIERGRFDANITHYEFFARGSTSTYSTNLGGMFNFAYKIGDGSAITFQNTYNNASDNETVVMEGFTQQEINNIRQYGSDYVQKTLYASQIGGEHSISFLNSLLDWKLGYSQSRRNEPDYKRVRYFKRGDDPNDVYKVDIYNNNGVGNLAGRFFSLLNEKAISGKVDYTISLDENIKIKTGGLFESKNRDFYVRSFTITKSSYLIPNYYDNDFGYFVPNYGDDEFFNNYVKLEPDRLFDSENFSFNRLGYSEETKETDSYKANEGLFAAFAMTDFSLYFNEHRLRIITGLRLEDSRQKLYSFYPISVNNLDSTFVDRHNTNLLPSLNLVYELNKEMNLRGSASQTLTRPSLREFAPFTFFDIEFQGDVTGNVHLKEAIIQNYDIRWEWFPNPGEVLSFGSFFKVFTNAIEETLIHTVSNPQKSFANADGKAYNYGIEIEAKKNLGVLSDFMKYFFFNFNLAIVQSEITVLQNNSIDKRSMWGQSPYSLNFALFFMEPDWGTSVNLSYNVSGKRIIQVADIDRTASSDPHVYELPKNMIDLSVSQVIENLELKFVVHDLLNEKLIWEQAGKTVASNYRGRGFSLGLGFKL